MPRFGRSKQAAPRARGFTAAGTAIPLDNAAKASKEAAAHRRRPFDWQVDAWRMYDDLPELRSGARWMGDAVSRVRMFPAFQGEDPESEPVSIDEASVPDEIKTLCRDAMDQLADGDGGTAEIKRAGAENVFVAGEGWMVGRRDDDDPDGDLSWQVCSVEEIVVTDRTQPSLEGGPPLPVWAVKPHPVATPDELETLDPYTSELIRCYRRHPRWRSWPDAATKPALLIMEELLLITQSIMGSTRSHVSAGLLVVSDRLSWSSDVDDEELREGEPPPFSEVLKKHILTAIRDARDTASVMPIILEVADELIDKIKMVELSRPIDPEQIKRLDHLMGRLSVALDLPPSKLLGNHDSNYANAWLDNDEAIRIHVLPYAQLWADGIAMGYLRPIVEAAGFPDFAKVTIACDADTLLVRPNPAEHAIEALNVAVIGRAQAAKALGFSEEDVPEGAELDELLGILESIHNRRLGTDERVPGKGVQVDPAGSVVAPAPQGATGNQPAQEPPPAAQGDTPKPVTAAIGPGPSGLGPQWAREEARILRDVLIAADGELRHTLTRAGNRVRGAAQRDKGLQALARVTTPLELAARLGEKGIRELGISNDQLFSGGFGALGGQFATWTAGARRKAIAQLQDAGAVIDPDMLAQLDATAQTHREEGWALLAAGLLALAAPILYGQPQVVESKGEQSAMLTVPPSLVREALTMAGGGVTADSPTATGGLFAGEDWAQVIASMPNVEPAAYTWEVGAPDRPFEPHQDLAGTVFASWTDDQLENPDSWPDNDFLFPGDHDGCQCTAVADVTITDPEEG